MFFHERNVSKLEVCFLWQRPNRVLARFVFFNFDLDKNVECEAHKQNWAAQPIWLEVQIVKGFAVNVCAQIKRLGLKAGHYGVHCLTYDAGS